MATYACADLHGRLDLFNKIKQELKPKDKLYVLGDCGDRGPDPWDTVIKVITDPQTIYIKGNHEDLLVKAAKDYLNETYGDMSMYNLLSNGGKGTFDGLMKSGNPKHFINLLDKLPVEIEYINKQGQTIILNHCGRTLGKRYEPLWDREHLTDSWPTDESWANTIVIHGHTPIQYCKDYVETKEVKPYYYCGGHKIDIDLGAYSSGITCLLNLDTLEYKLIF